MSISPTKTDQRTLLKGRYLPQQSSIPDKVIVFSMDLDDTLLHSQNGKRIYDDKALKLMSDSLQKLADATNSSVLPIMVSNASIWHAYGAVHNNKNLENIFFHNNYAEKSGTHNPIFTRDNIVHRRLIGKQYKNYPYYLTKSLQKRKMINDIHNIVGWIHVGDNEHSSNKASHKPDEAFLENMARYHFKERYFHSLPPYIYSKLGFLSKSPVPHMEFSQSNTQDFSKDWQSFMDKIVKEIQNHDKLQKQSY